MFRGVRADMALVAKWQNGGIVFDTEDGGGRSAMGQNSTLPSPSNPPSRDSRTRCLVVYFEVEVKSEAFYSCFRGTGHDQMQMPAKPTCRFCKVLHVAFKSLISLRRA